MTYLTNREAALHLCNGGKLEICLRDEWYPGTGGNILLYPESIDSPSPYRADAAAITTPVVGAGEAGDVRQAVRVKRLEWFEAQLPSRGGGKWQSSGYTICKIEGLFLVDFAGDSKSDWHFTTLEAAQDFAYAHKVASITAALEPDPTPALSWKAMQTAAAEKIEHAGPFYIGPVPMIDQERIYRAILAMTGPTDAQLLAEAVKLEAVRELVRAAKWIGVVAQTTGGTAGPDIDLIEAIDVLANALAHIGGAA